MRNLILVLGDQLTLSSPALEDFDPAQDRVLMIEAPGESTGVWSHQARITVFLSAMRHFREPVLAQGWPLDYIGLADEPEGHADRFTDRILDNLAEDLADLVMGAFEGQGKGDGGWLSSIFSLFAGKRATGGSVTAGQPYLVGERRPEVFVPNVNGTVIPSVNAAMNRTQAGRGGGGLVEHRIVVVPERESFITLATSAAQPVGFVAASAAIAQGRADSQNAQRVAPYRRG